MDKKDLLNKVSGWLVILSGTLLFIYNLIDIKSTLEILGGFSLFKALLGAVGLVFIGIYVLRFEKWAVILSGVFGITSLIHSRMLFGFIGGGGGLFSGGLLGFVLGITPYLLIVNWIFYRKKVKYHKDVLDNNRIRWLVGILVVLHVLGLLSGSYGLIESSNSLDELTARYGVYDEQRDRIEEFLTEDGYEVLSVFINNYSDGGLKQLGYSEEVECNSVDEYGICWTDKTLASVEMKSLGNRNQQLGDALRTMGVVHPNAFVYKMTIKSPTDTCEYAILGDTHREYTDVDIRNDRSEESLELKREKYEKVLDQLDQFKVCS
jgi:hypothetical protein